MTNATFTPKADDKFASPVAMIEVATIKPSGYINHRGMYPADVLPQVSESIREYFKVQGRGEPVIYTRSVGAEVWSATETPEVAIPDELPEDFQ